ncbi:MAG: hypothetical protein QM650_02200 [Microlunatus sp.]
MTVTKRKSLPLSERDLQDLELLRRSPDRRIALEALVHAELPSTASEAQLLSALLAAGLEAVNQKVAEESYASEAAARRASDATQRAVHRRRQPDWAGEAE